VPLHINVFGLVALVINLREVIISISGNLLEKRDYCTGFAFGIQYRHTEVVGVACQCLSKSLLPYEWQNSNAVFWSLLAKPIYWIVFQGTGRNPKALLQRYLLRTGYSHLVVHPHMTIRVQVREAWDLARIGIQHRMRVA
jgi:hypothetical protein